MTRSARSCPGMTTSSPTAGASRWCPPTGRWARASASPSTTRWTPPRTTRRRWRPASRGPAFLGNRLPDREARVEAFFLKAAEHLPGARFLLGGSGWEARPLPSNVTRLGHVYTHEHNALNCSARAVLNIHRDSMARFGFSPATRVFEAAGAGACLITDAFLGVELFLEPGREVLVARSGEEVAEHVRRLTDAEARRIGQAALRRVLAGHTYLHRVSQVEAALGLRTGSATTTRECVA
ncbi:glycosyltransferase [Myxococcus sp. MxC21-1]|uniref:CgeB family protein n=1 Tax=Myxococcus sp. MxC21-1 TaxID=3041439 RepID=UPI00292F3E21|nr:glycosyltransferase [Myxococcus sp. MxC21-1]WNZ63862.1 glycosyltransferase [Myxococcus sp. MxC21-1]